jgi:hypothetical protein
MADTELIDETAASSVEATDLLYVVKDPSGTPLDRKATAAQVAAYVATTLGGSGGGDVAGPASSTDNAIARFDGTTGKIIQNNSKWTITDGGRLLNNDRNTTLIGNTDSEYGIGFNGNSEVIMLINSGITNTFGDNTRLRSAGKLGWTNTTSTNDTMDTSISRAAGGAVQIGSGSAANNDGRLDCAWMKWDGMARTTAQFDKTNTTLADVTNLSITVASGKTYRFKAILFVTADATGGLKVALSGTATITSARYDIVAVNKGTSAIVISSEKTALNSSSGHAGATTATVTVEGVITVNVGGTLTVQFAQNAANGTSSVLVGSSLLAHEF